MKKPILTIGSVFIALISQGNLVGQLNEASSPTGQEVKKVTVLQQKLGDCIFDAAKPVAFGNGHMVADAGGTVKLEGVNRQGESWSATYQTNPGAGCQLWSADLMGNGQNDLAFVEFGINNSGGWDTTLSMLVFDDKGRPFPWQATSKFTVSDKGIDQIVLLGTDRHPAVLVPVHTKGGQSDSAIEYDTYFRLAYASAENPVRLSNRNGS